MANKRLHYYFARTHKAVGVKSKQNMLLLLLLLLHRNHRMSEDDRACSYEYVTPPPSCTYCQYDNCTHLLCTVIQTFCIPDHRDDLLQPGEAQSSAHLEQPIHVLQACVQDIRHCIVLIAVLLF